MTVHTEFRKGQRLVVIYKDGTRIVDKYIEKKSGCIFLKQTGRIPISKLRSVIIKR